MINANQLIPFNLEKAKAGAAIQCRDGTPAKFIAHVPEAREYARVIFLREGLVYMAHENGRLTTGGIFGADFDLFMAPERVTMWLNMYRQPDAVGAEWRGSVWASREMADRFAIEDRIACVEVPVAEGQGMESDVKQ